MSAGLLAFDSRTDLGAITADNANLIAAMVRLVLKLQLDGKQAILRKNKLEAAAGPIAYHAIKQTASFAATQDARSQARPVAAFFTTLVCFG